MGEFYEGYFVLPSDAELTPEAIYRPTGETKMVPTKIPVYVDVLDEDGEPTGEQRFSHYDIDHDTMIEIPLSRGGWSASANNGDMIAVILSTESVLDELAAQPENIEIERIYANGEAVEDVPAPQITAETVEEIRQEFQQGGVTKEVLELAQDKLAKDNPNKPTDEEKAAKKAAKNQKLKAKGFEEIPEEVEEPEETIEYVFQQVEPGYKFGKVNLG